MNEQPSYPSRSWNQSCRTSKIASNCSSGVLPRCRLLLDQTESPDLLATLQHGQHEVVLRREVAVKGCLGHTGAFDHLVGADRPDSTPAEQLICRSQDSFTSRRGGRYDIGSCHSEPYHTLRS